MKCLEVRRLLTAETSGSEAVSGVDIIAQPVQEHIVPTLAVIRSLALFLSASFTVHPGVRKIRLSNSQPWLEEVFG
jgi:hypothetical protein